MKYLVMELHPGYAVVLDEAGRFLKAADLGYQVGDTVTDIVEMRSVAPRRRHIRQLALSLAAAACLCLAFLGVWQNGFAAFATVRIQINPDVLLHVSRSQRVVGLEGLNADGQALIAGYSYRGKDQTAVTDELVDRAMDMGFLSAGKAVTITVGADSDSWRRDAEQALVTGLEQHLAGAQIVIRLGGDAPAGDGGPSVTIPIAGGQTNAHDDEDDGDSDDGDDDREAPDDGEDGAAYGGPAPDEDSIEDDDRRPGQDDDGDDAPDDDTDDNDTDD